MAIRNDTSPVYVAESERVGLRPKRNYVRTPSDIVPNQRIANVLRVLADAGMNLRAPIFFWNAGEDGLPKLADV